MNHNNSLLFMAVKEPYEVKIIGIFFFKSFSPDSQRARKTF